MQAPTQTRVHPLFDPTSFYSRMRMSAEGKMRGYIYSSWSIARHTKVSLPQPQELPGDEQCRLADEVRKAANALRGQGTNGQVATSINGAVHAPAFCVQDRWMIEPFVVIDGETQPLRWLDGGLYFCLCRESNEHAFVVAFGRASKPASWDRSGVSRCRLLLCEPEAVERMKGLLGSDDPLRIAFRAQHSSVYEIAQSLAAKPEMEGGVLSQDGELHFSFDRLEVTPRYRTLPPRKETLRAAILLYPLDDERIA